MSIYGSLFGHILSGPVLRDTARVSRRYPPIAPYGVFGVSTWPIGCDTHPPPPFSERFPRGEHAKWRCDTHPPQKGYLSRYWRDTLWKQGKWVRYPPLRYYLEKVLCDRGGVSRTGPLSPSGVHLWKLILGTYSWLFEPISAWEVVVQATNKPLIQPLISH